MRRQRAAEQRESVAHGFSRGLKVEGFEPRSGERKPVWKADSIAPSGGYGFFLLRFHGLRRGLLSSATSWLASRVCFQNLICAPKHLESPVAVIAAAG